VPVHSLRAVLVFVGKGVGGFEGDAGLRKWFDCVESRRHSEPPTASKSTYPLGQSPSHCR